MRVAIYVRVSTTDQSCEMQLTALREYCRLRGWEIVAVYEDAGVSGSKSSRPALDRLMLAAERKEFQTVMVWKFDRMGRSSMHLLRVLETFRNLGIEFVSFSENLDTSSAMGKLVFSILAAVAEMERENTRERVVAGLKNARSKGVSLGRRRNQIDVDALLKLRNAGKTLAEIADSLGTNTAKVCRTLGRIAA
jgi:DNA invertase Pin-like site-specific DNA recombinase